MTNISIDICGAHAHKTGQEGILTTGMVGATVTFAFCCGEWDGLMKTAVFRGSDVTKTKTLTDATITIPPETLRDSGYLEIGVEGYNVDGSLVIPTVWVSAARIHEGANANGDPAGETELPIWVKAVQEAMPKTIVNTLVALWMAPVILDADGAVLTDGDGAILINT